MLLEHERNYDFGMDALVTVCSRNTNGIMILAWMLWMDALVTDSSKQLEGAGRRRWPHIMEPERSTVIHPLLRHTKRTASKRGKRPD